MTNEWNSSQTGNYLWVNGYVAEMMPDVMTPSTWSLIQLWNTLPPFFEVPPEYHVPVFGNIGGRLYTNLTPLISPLVRAGMKPDNALTSFEGIWGQVPRGLNLNVIPLPRGFVILNMAWGSRRRNKQLVRSQGDIADFADEIPPWSVKTHRRIASANEGQQLVNLWRKDIESAFKRACHLVMVTLSNDQFRLQRSLTNLLGEEAACTLLAGLGELASLQSVVDLVQVKEGYWTREEYREHYGHRSPYELELSAPRPTEDPGWLDSMLSESIQSALDGERVTEEQRSKSTQMWTHFEEVYRRKSGLARRSLRTISEVARLRDAARSEQARIVGVIRAWILRAGDLTGLDEDGFFLTLDELCDVLQGDNSAAAHIPERKALYARYRDLPRYPAVIHGPFDPVAWAADPDRRVDLFDAHATHPAPPDSLTGFPGASSTVEGTVRRLDRVEDGAQFQPGEVLVTATTNVGWTPLFTRAAAIITDLGVPISHAAIVSRELGLPAVVGCANASARLKTGDRVRVDGARGTVTVIESA